MATKTLKCRTHEGGHFTVPSSRGRYPVRCTDQNVCDAHPALTGKRSRRENPSDARQSRLASRVARQQTSQNRRRRTEREAPAPEPKPAPRARQKASPVTVKHNPSVPLAYEARRLLEPLGWKVSGRAGEDAAEDLDYPASDGPWAVVTAKRGTETISLTWVNGKLTKQDYSMFPTDKPTLPGMPRKKLSFEPDEMDDSGLIKALSGKTVTWWNVTGQSKEKATMPHRTDQRIKIEHLMNGHGDEAARIVSFVDQDGTGFRAFNINALVSVQ